jgi:Ceramidase
VTRLSDPRRKQKLWLLCGVALIAVVAMAFVSPIAQPIDYHIFSDARTLFGTPNFWNVLSNVPFLIVGVIGLVKVLRRRYQGGLQSLYWLYAVFFIGIASVCVGSGYYHWAPSNATLAWDRLPMAVAFMVFVSIVIGEHISERAAKVVVLPLIVLGVVSVWYWHYTETLGRGDLRLYGLVQFLSLTLIALIFWLFPSRLSGMGYLWAMFGGYALAKVLEELDPLIYEVGNVMSGHALKHVAAAAGMYFFVVALRRRRLLGDRQ